MEVASSQILINQPHLTIDGYLPVIVLHGIFSNAAHMQDMVSMITTAHPGTTVHNIDGYDDVGSLGPMLDQVKFFKQKMLPIFQNNTDGVNMICFSQGQYIKMPPFMTIVLTVHSNTN